MSFSSTLYSRWSSLALWVHHLRRSSEFCFLKSLSVSCNIENRDWKCAFIHDVSIYRFWQSIVQWKVSGYCYSTMDYYYVNKSKSYFPFAFFQREPRTSTLEIYTRQIENKKNVETGYRRCQRNLSSMIEYLPCLFPPSDIC